MRSKKTASILISLLNEEENITAIYEQLLLVTNQETSLNWEFVFVDDGSTDRSYELLKTLRKNDPRIKLVKLSRNFGAHEGTAAAIHYATGEVGIIMSADLQDPPAIIHDFIIKWREGYDIVWGYRASRKDGFLKKMMAILYYWVIKKIGQTAHPAKGRQSGSFCLITRKVMDQYKKLNEHNRVTFELISWFGFNQIDVRYDRPERYAGKSKFSLNRQMKTGLDSLFAMTQVPIRVLTFFGVFLIVLSVLWGVSLIVQGLVWGTKVPGWTSIMMTVLFLGSIQLISIGFFGEYLWRILEESRGRPLFTVAEVLESAPIETHEEIEFNSQDTMKIC